MSAASPWATERHCRRHGSSIYVEDQYLWSSEVAAPFAQALRERPGLRLVAVVPHYPDRGGRHALAPNAVGRERAVRACGRRAGTG